MATISKIFAVIDPSTDNQIALVRAGKIAGRNENIAVHVYEALYSNQENSDKDALRRVETARHQAWLESLVAPLRESGIKVDVERMDQRLARRHRTGRTASGCRPDHQGGDRTQRGGTTLAENLGLVPVAQCALPRLPDQERRYIPEYKSTDGYRRVANGCLAQQTQ